MLVSSILQICLTQIQTKEKKILIAMEAINRAMCPENDGTGYVLEKGKKMRQCLWQIILSTPELLENASELLLTFQSRTGMNWQLFSLYSGCNLNLKCLGSHLLVFIQNIHTDVTQEKFLVYEHLLKTLTATSSFEMVKKFICWTKLQLDGPSGYLRCRWSSCND